MTIKPLTKLNNNPTTLPIFLTTSLLVASTVIMAMPKQVKAAPFDQKPVPTYSPVTSTDTVTTATVPANLVTEWRGVYNRPAYSLIGKTEHIPGASLKEFLNAWLHDRQLKIPMRAFKFNPAAVYEWTNTIASSVNAQASEPAMKINDAGRVTEFTPPQTGKSLDRYGSTLKIIEALSNGETTIDLTVRATQPKNSLGSLNKLGIKELIGRGESKFNGSPANRRHNIRVGLKKIEGVIVKPGEEFSFNKYLGPVEASTGFKPELVIKATGTVPEFGGGLCQVSSTTFRAAMHAGLPITARRNHSYAVQYYAPQGTDATIYPGVQDLKFTNDTGNSILIWPYLKDENYLIFDFYGTYDGRKIELGTPYAYDKKGDGSMKATWKRTVTRKGKEPTHDNFYSVYQPPALFHKQEVFVPAGTKPGDLPPGFFVGDPAEDNSNSSN